MVFFNYALRKLNAKIVYYGPGLCGKTTNLQWIHDHFEGGHRGEMISLATEGDRTIFFDLLPLEIGKIRGLDVTLQLYTVPGQVHYNSTRQLVLKGADGVVFVADSQRAMRASNADSWKNLKENLLLQGIELEGFPHVLQFNKRDLKDIMSLEEMDEVLNEYDAPFFESVATDGIGVQETLEGIVKLVMRSLRDRYEPVGRPQEGISLRAPQPGASLRPAGTLPPPVAPFRPPVPDVSLAPPASGAGPEEAGGASEVSEEAITHPSMSIPSPPNDGLWALGGPADHGQQDWTPPGGEEGFGTSGTGPGLEPESPPEESPVADAAADSAVREDMQAGQAGDGSSRGAGDGMDRPVSGEVTVELGPTEAREGEADSAEPVTSPAEEFLPPDEETTGPITETWEMPAEESPFEITPEEEPQGSFQPSQEDEEAFPEPAPGEDSPPFMAEELARGDDEDAGPFGEPAVAGGPDSSEAVATEPQPTAEEDRRERALWLDAAAVQEPGAAAAEELVRKVLETPHEMAGEPVPPSSHEVVEPGPEPDGGEVTPEFEASAGEPLGEETDSIPSAPGDRPPLEPVVFGMEDPFAFVEPASEAPVVAEASAVLAVPMDGTPATTGEASSNQLQLRIEGTQALARSGDVRELDILVPVPGKWIGNRRVTLQLRLTLVPAEEDQ